MQFSVGTCYANGLGVVKDLAEAVIWYKLAAEAGCTKAQTNLGAAFMHGHGIAIDGAQAISWLERAAASGDIAAVLNLGTCHYNGHAGMPVDSGYSAAVAPSSSASP